MRIHSMSESLNLMFSDSISYIGNRYSVVPSIISQHLLGDFVYMKKYEIWNDEKV